MGVVSLLGNDFAAVTIAFKNSPDLLFRSGLFFCFWETRGLCEDCSMGLVLFHGHTNTCCTITDFAANPGS